MPSSGTTAKTTSSDTAVEVVAAGAFHAKHVLIVNEHTVPGFFSFENPAVWHRLPANSSFLLSFTDGQGRITGPLQVKRTPSGTDLDKIYGSLI